ncbi:MAG: efflux RND transporter periplasmic adaptor subunit [Ignavibacteriae bacterium]|nr:efflux RND transporter periplasmic adaptor subunit [Ignavibacteriota bacterium]
MMRNPAERALLLALLIVSIPLALTGCGGNSGPGKGGFAMPPMPVEVSPVKIGKMTDKFEAVGTIEAIEATSIVSEIDGAVKSVPFDEGGYIRKGGLIAQLDESQLAADVARTEALREQNKVTFERVKSVVDQGAGAPQDLDDAAAALKVADANLALAKARWTKTRIVAPFDGVIGARRVSVGTFVRTGQQITDLANIDEIRVTFAAPERLLAQLTRGASVSVSSTAFPGSELKGRILAIEPMIDPATRSTRVVARVQNSGRKLRPGMSANVSAVLSETPDALMIPSEAVFGSGNQLFAFVVKPDSTVKRVPLKLGLRLPDAVEVVEGLKEGMSVVRAGHQKLFDGGKVMPMMSRDTLAAK